MTLFLLYTAIFWLGVASLSFLLWISIQPGNWAERWQIQLRKWDLAGKELLYRTLGGCAICTSHLIAQLSFPFYLAFSLATDIWPLGWITSIIWYGLYIGITTNLNLFFITKLHK
jgi:hypothetical protein